MNFPNKLTLLRVLLIPVFLTLFLMGYYFFSLIVFGAAAITDALDGYIARKRNLITNFGKLMDPLADKLLTIAAFVCLLKDTMIGAVCLIIIISRELIVTSIRLIAAEKGIIIAADKWGKLKTILQMVWICFALLFFSILYESGFAIFDLLGSRAWLWNVYNVLLLVVVFVTVGSGINYCIKSRHLFRDM
jgi:CDP-diacylglycerol--glycerol-3-phosphate 3-phosphatidyltransferase